MVIRSGRSCTLKPILPTIIISFYMEPRLRIPTVIMLSCQKTIKILWSGSIRWGMFLISTNCHNRNINIDRKPGGDPSGFFYVLFFNEGPTDFKIRSNNDHYDTVLLHTEFQWYPVKECKIKTVNTLQLQGNPVFKVKLC